MINQIMSMLNKFVPIGIATKGLEKLDPRFKKFFGAAAGAGYGAEQAVDFLRGRVGKSSQGGSYPTPEEETANIGVERSYAPQKLAAGLGGAALGGLGGAALSGLQGKDQVHRAQQSSETAQSQARTYDPLAALKKHPELAKFIQKEATAGGNAESITAKARKQHKLADIVKSIESEIQEPFESLLGRLIGQQRQGSQSAQQNGASPAMSEFMAAMQQYKSIMAGRNGRGV